MPDAPDSPATVRAVGLAQRRLVFAVLASFLGLFPPFLIVTIPFQIYSVLQLAQALRLSSTGTTLYVIAMFVPCVSLLALLSLNGRATWVLTNAGVRVGLLGASKGDLPALDEGDFSR